MLLFFFSMISFVENLTSNRLHNHASGLGESSDTWCQATSQTDLAENLVFISELRE